MRAGIRVEGGIGGLVEEAVDRNSSKGFCFLG
jgi:hypothetical protein